MPYMHRDKCSNPPLIGTPNNWYSGVLWSDQRRDQLLPDNVTKASRADEAKFPFEEPPAREYFQEMQRRKESY